MKHNTELVSINNYSYLDKDDLSEFKEYYSNDNEGMLVAGSRSVSRLSKYLPSDEFKRFQVILSALNYDFHIPSVRYLSAIALEIYLNYLIPERGENDHTTRFAKLEFRLLETHLTEDEREEYRQKREMAITQWPVYIKDPASFQVPT